MEQRGKYNKSVIAVSEKQGVLHFASEKEAKRHFKLHQEEDVVSLIKNNGVFGGFYFDYELDEETR